MQCLRLMKWRKKKKRKLSEFVGRWKCFIYQLIFYLFPVKAQLPWGSGKWRRNKAQSEKTLPCFHLDPFDVAASGDLDIISCPSSKRHQTRCCIQNQIRAWAKMWCVCMRVNWLHVAYVYASKCVCTVKSEVFSPHELFQSFLKTGMSIVFTESAFWPAPPRSCLRTYNNNIIIKMKRRSHRQCLYSWIAIFSLASAGTMHNYISTATMQKEYYISSGPL